MNGWGGDGTKDSGLYVRRALKKKQRQEEIRKASERYKRSMQKFNLYIKNFPLDTTEEELKQYFARFGEIKSIRIMKQVIHNPESISSSSNKSKSEASDSRPGSPPDKSSEDSDKVPTSKAQEKIYGDSLGFGFVSFATAEAAAKAKLESRNMPFRDRFLYVS